MGGGGGAQTCPQPYKWELYLHSLQYTSLLNLAMFLMLKPFQPNIHIQILQTDLYTSPLRIS